MKRFSVLFLGMLLFAAGRAQSVFQTNTDSTAVPFLRIAPDARMSGMGDAGSSVSDDANAVHWNLANLAFARKKVNLSISYTPWMRALVPDVNHAYVSFFIKPDSVSAVGTSVRVFSMGNVTTAGITGTPTQFKQNEFAMDIGYTRKLSEKLSAGITARFIESNPGGIYGIVVRDGGGRAFAGDISAAWKQEWRRDEFRRTDLCVGASISNFGTKMWYEDRDSAEFLPTNARLGAGVVFIHQPEHQITLQVDVNKLLVPPPSFVNTMKEKLAQITFGGGIEYDYRHLFKARSGYYHEFASHGSNRYVTLGAGIEYSVFGLDFSYLIPVNGLRSPLENTIRFSLLFSFDEIRKPEAKQLR